MGAATRDDVARLAGTSTAVVSYVINNGPRNVSPATRERVLAAIAELDYRPNVVARSLRAQRTETFGLIVPDITNPFFAELAHALEARAHAADRLLLLGNSEEDVEHERDYVRNFLERRVDGVIVVGVTSHSALDVLADFDGRVVIVDRPLAHAGLSTVSIDHERAAYEATRHLIGHGHDVIACIAGPEDQSVAADRVQGWRRALTERGARADDELVLRSDFSPEGGVAAARSLMRAAPRPTAAFVSSDQQAQGVLSELHREGVRVPEDVALVSFDGTRQSRYTVPGLSVVQQPFDELADRVIRLLLEPAEQDAPPESVRVDFDLVLRESCGCPHAGPVPGTTPRDPTTRAGEPL